MAKIHWAAWLIIGAGTFFIAYRTELFIFELVGLIFITIGIFKGSCQFVTRKRPKLQKSKLNLTCRFCSNELKYGDKFCSQCGSRFFEG